MSGAARLPPSRVDGEDRGIAFFDTGRLTLMATIGMPPSSSMMWVWAPTNSDSRSGIRRSLNTPIQEDRFVGFVDGVINRIRSMVA